VEEAFLHAIANAAAGQGASALVAAFVNGPRNHVIKDFLSRSGFREVKANRWELTISNPPGLPKHIQWVSGANYLQTP
jgi:predicted enzyme involved in methoxymalonyl-ACP biosynthesis